MENTLDGKETNAPAEGASDQSQIDLVEIARNEFHRKRKIIVNNIPDVTCDEVISFFGLHKVTDININNKNRSVVVTVVNGDEADTIVETLNNSKLLDKEVEVRINPCNTLLCVAHLPAGMEETGFHALVQSHGPTQRCFLMRDSKGASKGYGFVEFSCQRDSMELIRGRLNGKLVQTSIIMCDFVKSNIVTFSQLNSTCLHVSNLPDGFCDDDSLKKLFSPVALPLFCRVGRRSEVPVGFALVEFLKSCDAERTYELTQRLAIDSSNVVVRYCIPGQSAPEAFNQLLNLMELKNGELEVPSVESSVPSLIVPQVNPKLIGLLETSPFVLDSFKRLLQVLQQHVTQHQQQFMSAKPGLLGEAPTPNNPLVKLELQASILAIMVAAQLQTIQPTITMHNTMMQMLPPGLSIQTTFGNPSVCEALTTIQSMVANRGSDFDEQDTTEGDADQTKSKEIPKLLKMKIPGVLQIAPLLAPGTVLNNLTQVLAAIQKSQSPSAVVEKVVSGSEGCAPQQSILGEPPTEKPGILGPMPLMMFGRPASTPQRVSPAFANPVLASVIEVQINHQLFIVSNPQMASAASGVQAGIKGLLDIANAAPPGSKVQGIVKSLLDLPMVRPYVGMNTGDGIMGSGPNDGSLLGGAGRMSVGNGKSEDAQMKSSLGILGSGPSSGSILGSGPSSGGILGSGPLSGVSRQSASDGDQRAGMRQGTGNASKPFAGQTLSESSNERFPGSAWNSTTSKLMETKQLEGRQGNYSSRNRQDASDNVQSFESKQWSIQPYIMQPNYAKNGSSILGEPPSVATQMVKPADSGSWQSPVSSSSSYSVGNQSAWSSSQVGSQYPNYNCGAGLSILGEPPTPVHLSVPLVPAAVASILGAPASYGKSILGDPPGTANQTSLSSREAAWALQQAWLSNATTEVAKESEVEWQQKAKQWADEQKKNTAYDYGYSSADVYGSGTSTKGYYDSSVGGWSDSTPTNTAAVATSNSATYQDTQGYSSGQGYSTNQGYSSNEVYSTNQGYSSNEGYSSNQEYSSQGYSSNQAYADSQGYGSYEISSDTTTGYGSYGSTTADSQTVKATPATHYSLYGDYKASGHSQVYAYSSGAGNTASGLGSAAGSAAASQSTAWDSATYSQMYQHYAQQEYSTYQGTSQSTAAASTSGTTLSAANYSHSTSQQPSYYNSNPDDYTNTASYSTLKRSYGETSSSQPVYYAEATVKRTRLE